MEEPHIAYFVAAYSILALGCFFFTKGLYKEISARIVLAVFSPLVFIVVGPLLAAVIRLGINLILMPLYKIGILKAAIPDGHMMGITFLIAAVLCVWTLKIISSRQNRAEPVAGGDAAR
jgi:hypothetical protein